MKNFLLIAFLILCHQAHGFSLDDVEADFKSAVPDNLQAFIAYEYQCEYFANPSVSDEEASKTIDTMLQMLGGAEAERNNPSLRSATTCTIKGGKRPKTVLEARINKDAFRVDAILTWNKNFHFALFQNRLYQDQLAIDEVSFKKGDSQNNASVSAERVRPLNSNIYLAGARLWYDTIPPFAQLRKGNPSVTRIGDDKNYHWEIVDGGVRYVSRFQIQTIGNKEALVLVASEQTAATEWKGEGRAPGTYHSLGGYAPLSSEIVPRKIEIQYWRPQKDMRASFLYNVISMTQAKETVGSVDAHSPFADVTAVGVSDRRFDDQKFVGYQYNASLSDEEQDKMAANLFVQKYAAHKPNIALPPSPTSYRWHLIVAGSSMILVAIGILLWKRR